MKKTEAQEELEELINKIVQKLIAKEPKEWMNLSEGAKYAGVAYNTFKEFQIMGLKITEIGRVKRVSRKEIDKFFNENSY